MYDLSDIDENYFAVAAGLYLLQGTKLVFVTSSFNI